MSAKESPICDIGVSCDSRAVVLRAIIALHSEATYNSREEEEKSHTGSTKKYPNECGPRGDTNELPCSVYHIIG